jgi:hypothetical protein
MIDANQTPENGTVKENWEGRIATPNSQQYPVMTVNQKTGNGIGVAGFVLALLGLIFSWVPVIGWIFWLLGLIFSAVGMTKKPKGLAIAGLIISLIDLIVLVALAGALAAFML